MAILLLVAFYLPALDYGYLWDDLREVHRGLGEVFERLTMHPRPLYYLSFALTNPIFDEAWQHRLVNLALFAGVLATAARLARRFEVRDGSLLLAATFLHPSFLFPVTWISQRNDLMLLIFILLAVLNVHRSRGFAYLLLSDFAKAPFVLHNVWYASVRWRASVWQAAAALAVAGGLILAVLGFWSGVTAASTSPMSELTSGGPLALVFTLLVRAAKIAEGIVLALAPFEAYWGLNWVVVAGVALAYAVCWTTLAVVIVRNFELRAPAWSLVVIGFLNAAPFAIVSDPRVVCPVIPLFYFGAFALARRAGVARAVLAALVALNVGGTVLNYRLSDTGAYRPEAAPDYTICGTYEMQFPMERWRCDRGDLARRVVVFFNAAIASRPQ